MTAGRHPRTFLGRNDCRSSSARRVAALGEWIDARWAAVPEGLILRGSEGPIAQLGERLLCKQEVTGSIPVGSIDDCLQAAAAWQALTARPEHRDATTAALGAYPATR
jgi:hypothetical protein